MACDTSIANVGSSSDLRVSEGYEDKATYECLARELKPPVITNVCTSAHDGRGGYTLEQENARLPYREFGIWWVHMTLCDTPVGVSQSGDRKPPLLYIHQAVNFAPENNLKKPSTFVDKGSR
jgi:hypothetical protein